MWQRKYRRPMVAPCHDGLSESCLARVVQVPRLRILADDERQLDARHPCEKLASPGRRTFWPGWQIPGVPGPRIAETHRQDRHASSVVEHCLVDTHPVTKPITACIVEGHAALMHLAARCLPGDQDPRTRLHLQHRARPERKVCLAKPSGAELALEFRGGGLG